MVKIDITIEVGTQIDRRREAEVAHRGPGIWLEHLLERLVVPGITTSEAGDNPARQLRVAEELQQCPGLELVAGTANHPLIVVDSIRDRGKVTVVTELMRIEHPAT